MKLKINKDKHFRTCNFQIAAFLYSKEQQLVDIVPSYNPSQKEFVFTKTSELDALVDKYKFGDKTDNDLLVSVHSYEQARRQLLDRLNDADNL